MAFLSVSSHYAGGNLLSGNANIQKFASASPLFFIRIF